MAVYDAFMFFNEFDLLSVRLEEHDPFVDYFILVQADRTFTGQKKKLLFSKEDRRFKKFAHKIILVNAELEENPKSAWDNEGAQRQASLEAVKFQPEDIIYLADVDEIISREHWPYLLQRMEKENFLGVWLRMFYYFINLELVDSPWVLPKLMKAKILQETQPIVGDKLRASPGAVITPFPCGWHFSYLSSIDQIIHKICSFSHQEFNNHQFNNPKDISDAIRNKKDLFGRNMVFKPIKVNKSWPTAMVHSSSWDKFICPVTLLESNIDRFKEVTHQIKESIKPVIKPLLGRLKLTREVPETYNGFGSHLFESLIAAKPKKQDPKEWRRLIEFLAINIPTLDGDVSARQCAELFMQIVGKLKPGSKIVELGSWKGRSSVFASRAAGLMDSTLYCVDTWKENLRAEAEHPTVEEATKNDVFQDFKNNTTRLGCDNVVICRGNSVEIAKKWQHGSIDFIFVGASPNYDSVVEDLKAWVPHLKPGCIIWGNDWNREERLNPKRNMRSTTPGKFSVHSPG